MTMKTMMRAACLAVFAALTIGEPVLADEAAPKMVSGKDIVLDRGKGNCMACHEIPGIPENILPGNFGPALAGVKERYPDKSALRARIWNEASFQPNTSMPPFGKHHILTEDEINKVTDFIYGL